MPLQILNRWAHARSIIVEMFGAEPPHVGAPSMAVANLQGQLATAARPS